MPRAPKPKPKPLQEAMIGVGEAAQQLGVDAFTIRRLIASGKLPAYRIGSRIIRVYREDVRKLLIPVEPKGN